MTIGIRLQSRLFIIGDGVSNSVSLPIGTFPLQDVPRNPVILSVSTGDPTIYSASLDAHENHVIVSTISGDPFNINVDTFVNVILEV